METDRHLHKYTQHGCIVSYIGRTSEPSKIYHLKNKTPQLITFVSTSTVTAVSLSLYKGPTCSALTDWDVEDWEQTADSLWSPASAQSPRVSPEILCCIAIIYFELMCGRRELKEFMRVPLCPKKSNPMSTLTQPSVTVGLLIMVF